MLKRRLATALVLAPIALALILFGSPAMIAALFAIIVAAGMREWVRFAGLGTTAQWIGAAAGLAAPFAIYATRSPDRLLMICAIGAGFWLLACAWLANPGFARARSPGTTALKLVSGFFVMLPAVAGALSLRESGAHGAWWLLIAVVLIWIGDSGAYFAGVRYGRHKLAPTISPGKSWEGVAGAVVVVALFGALAGWLLGFRGAALAGMMLLTVVTLAVSIVGDLFESLQKRHAGMKDSGTLIPGHGGMLDRFDSLFAALPIFALGRHLLGA